ncbi:unnamed protein product [Ranitomeya imitator]|uniref:C2H2-type domain-containing protein n=1 Tax=Ranitomeya imitator TaxID=111125 RepID=A0ABN9LA27_9NEOB|nr:unnamed protein product [Ranitomeya imitator]
MEELPGGSGLSQNVARAPRSTGDSPTAQEPPADPSSQPAAKEPPADPSSQPAAKEPPADPSSQAAAQEPPCSTGAPCRPPHPSLQQCSTPASGNEPGTLIHHNDNPWQTSSRQSHASNMEKSPTTQLKNRYQIFVEDEDGTPKNEAIPASKKEKGTQQQVTAKSTAKKQRRVVVVGDSLLRGTEAAICRPDITAREVCCLPGAMIKDVTDRIPKLFSSKDVHPFLLIHVGTNDTARKDLPTICKDFEELGKKVKELDAQDWRIANVVPIFKKGSKSEPGNYRPHGFMRNRSCQTNLISFYEEVSYRLDHGESLDVVYLDFSKAFDTVPHKSRYRNVMAEKEELKPGAYVCDICKVTCSSPLPFFEHMTGQKHRAAAARVSHESVPQLHRFQYVIDTFMKAEPLVGLEYVEELQGKGLQGNNRYRCVLCGFQGQRTSLLLHITGLQHITGYVGKHHPQLLPQGAKATKKDTQLVAATICQTYGRKTVKEIREGAEPTKQCFIPRVLTPAKATKQAAAKICQDHGKKTITEDAEPTPERLAKQCLIPQLLPQAVKPTPKAMQLAAAIICQDYGKKSITESRKDAEPTHTSNITPSMQSHASNIIPRQTPSTQSHASNTTPRQTPGTQSHESNRTPRQTPSTQSHASNRTPRQTPSTPSHASNITPRRSPSTQSHASNIILTPERLAKHSSDPQSTRKPGNGDQLLAGFKGNAEFLDYLQKFQIRSDEDAKIIRVISENCWQALLRYGQEQGEEPWEEELPQGEDLRGQELKGEEPQGKASEDLPAPANRTDKGFSVGNHGKVVPASAAQTDATQLFFNSIKNMEEAEVRDILQKIAATNPAFRGINVPNVIQYLRATGRLKTS